MDQLNTHMSSVTLDGRTGQKFRTVHKEYEEPYQRSGPHSRLKNKGVIAIIPAYNEGLVIGSLVLELKDYVDEVVVVDDGSTDRTSYIASLAGATVLSMETNQGKANAMMEGFAYANKNEYSAVVMLDGDGQHKTDDIEAIVEPVLLGEADLVIGSRYLDQSSDIPFYRVLGQKTLDLFTNMGSNFVTTDSSSGFRALSKKALSNLDFKSEGYSIELDMIAHFSSRNLAIMEVPITVNYDVPHKHKKNAVLQGFDAFKDIFGIVGYKRPILLFAIPGILLTCTGCVSGFLMYSRYLAGSPVLFSMALVTALSLASGLLLINTGLIMNTMTQIVKMHR